MIPFAFLARYTHGSYGMNGVLMIAIFLLNRELPYRVTIQSVLMVLLILRMSGYPGDLSIQIWAIAALIPIWLYSGQKRSSSKVLQWSFTLFYPVHLLLLLLMAFFGVLSMIL